ncbi:MAG: hypothetical protein JWP52_3579, partial [Rhizobacter sp.]|nr:hypothetical protein [Rhizobacter sp.]
CAMRLVQTGDLLTLLSWQSQLRSHFLEMPPRLKLAFAWALGHAMASTEATRLLDQIEAGLTDDDPQTDDMRWECLALRALLRNVDDDGDAAYLLARQYLAHDPRDAWIRNVMLNIVASTHLRTGHWQAFHSVAPLVVVDEERTRPGCFVFNRCYHLCYRGIAEYHQGRLEDAASLFEQAVQIGDTQPEQFGIVAAPERAVWVLPASLLAQVRYQQNRLAEAATLIGECLESACVVAPLDFVAAAFQTAVRLAHCEGDGGRVSFLLDEADRLARARGWTRLESLNLLERVRICLISRRLAEAEGCLARLDTLTALSRDADVRKAYVARDAFLAHAWVDLAHGVVARNLVELRRRFHVSLAAKLPLEAARFGMTLALAQLQTADQAAATDSLTLACEQAAQAGAMRVLFDLPLPADAVVRLLQTHRDTLPADSAAARFLAGVLPAQAPAVVDLATGREAIEVLSGRERHVLKLVAQGQSNKEIARELGVAPDTIKYHLKSVFSKLGVGNRAQAAVQAKSFGLA